MKIKFVPSPSICEAIAVSVPLLTETIIMTAATPMMTPNMVKMERILFLVKPFHAIWITL